MKSCPCAENGISAFAKLVYQKKKKVSKFYIKENNKQKPAFL